MESFFRRRRATEAEMLQGEEEIRREGERLAREAYEERTQEPEAPQGPVPDPIDRQAPEGVGQPVTAIQVHAIATPARTPTPERKGEGEVVAGRMGLTGGRGEDGGMRMNPFHSRPLEIETAREAMEGDLGEVNALSGPLFNEEQVKRFEELQRAAPMLIGRVPEVSNAALRAAEGQRLQEVEAEKEKEKEAQKKIVQGQERLELLDRMRKMEEEVLPLPASK